MKLELEATAIHRPLFGLGYVPWGYITGKKKFFEKFDFLNLFLGAEIVSIFIDLAKYRPSKFLAGDASL